MSIDNFQHRHIGPDEHQKEQMLKLIGETNLDELINKVVPGSIRLQQPLAIADGISEYEYLSELKEIAMKNKIFKTYIGQGYYYSICPAVIQRNIFENPNWYTSYTPYQAEISQGRLEALLNFQTMVMELTDMEISNASLLDEATAAAEAMIMLFNTRGADKIDNDANVFFVDQNTFWQTIDVLKTRSTPLGIQIEIGDFKTFKPSIKNFAALVQYPAADGSIENYKFFIELMHEHHLAVTVVADLLSLTMFTPPGEWDADVVVGSTQRFGIPVGFGGPSAAYFATKEIYKRNIPGRIIGVSRDTKGNRALRMALQTREQHIKRERATSNICTSQALLAIMAGMYGVYHGNKGLLAIAQRIHNTALTLAEQISKLGYKIEHAQFFDTIVVQMPSDLFTNEVMEIAHEHEINFRCINDKSLAISVDETTMLSEINNIIEVFAIAVLKKFTPIESTVNDLKINNTFLRTSPYMQQAVFKQYQSETSMMRYINKLERKDISLTNSMISLGSCTMKMNAATELIPLSWPAFANIHPFVPIEQAEGFYQLITELGKDLCKITGMCGISFQPNSGAAGEYAGLMVIRQYLIKTNQSQRHIVLIPASAHGTNPASATQAGMKIVVVACDQNGNISLEDMKAKAELYSENLAACMITYPSTHGVFEKNIRQITQVVHQHGGQVYMDGANMNAQVGLTNPYSLGADVCHLNLHKTFAIPHGGGGPGAGPICVGEHLVEFLPSHSIVATGGNEGVSAVSSSPYGSASILIISYGYIKMMGGKGLTNATKYAILNANYLAAKLKNYYPILYRGEDHYNAHEFIIDCREFKTQTGIAEIDIAKRLMDYGFHAPTVSFPVHGTLMIEPTESESMEELDRFVQALVAIIEEIEEIRIGKENQHDNVLKNAPHTALEIASDTWTHPYSREKAAYPLKWIADNKYWPSVARIDDAYGDRNLICSCN